MGRVPTRGPVGLRRRLILIHDAWFVGGTVERALRRIEAAGYGVTRLWTAESGDREDDHLGLAVIENRRRAESNPAAAAAAVADAA